MSWNLEGKRVSAMYISKHLVTGTVVCSRVCYGGEVKHTIKLDREIADSKLGFSYEAGDGVVVRKHQIQKILSA